MLKRYAMSAVLLLVPVVSAAQTTVAKDEKAAVMAAVQKFFDTMTSRDAAGAESVLFPEGNFFAVREQDGKVVARARPHKDYIASLQQQKQRYVERAWDSDVRIHGPIAMVWTAYDFWIDGKFSHCGIDVFNLVKTPEGWKIASGVYTTERTGCPPSPLGPLKDAR